MGIPSAVLIAPLAIFRTTRVVSANLLMLASYIFGFGLRFWCAVATYEYWGWWGLLIGMVIFGFGVVPTGFLALALHSQWAVLGELVALGTSLIVTRLFAVWCFGKAMEHGK
jgi:hypothetical protein